MRITAAELWDPRTRLDGLERLARSLGIVVNERAKAAWGNGWRDWLISEVDEALWRDDVKAKAERRRERDSGYTVTDRRAR